MATGNGFFPFLFRPTVIAFAVTDIRIPRFIMCIVGYLSSLFGFWRLPLC